MMLGSLKCNLVNRSAKRENSLDHLKRYAVTLKAAPVKIAMATDAVQRGGCFTSVYVWARSEEAAEELGIQKLLMWSRFQEIKIADGIFATRIDFVAAKRVRFFSGMFSQQGFTFYTPWCEKEGKQ